MKSNGQHIFKEIGSKTYESPDLQAKILKYKTDS